MKRCFLYIIAVITVLCPVVSLAQKNSPAEDTRSKNRRFADSMYYVHTVKKQQEEEKQTAKNSVSEKIKDIKVPKQNTAQELIRNGEIPSPTLYQNKWFTERVKNGAVTLTNFPDQITLRLLGKNNNEKFCYPYKGIKTSGYGWRWGRPHTGIDIALNVGDKIYAAFDGVVRVARFNGGYGNMVLIRHYNNLETLYGHMSQLNVKPGQKVKAGDVIGFGGSTGRSTGPHLHFECRLLYACFDPEWIIDPKEHKLKTSILKINKSIFGLPASEQIAESRNKPGRLSKVNKFFEGSKYVSSSELSSLVKKKEAEKLKPAVINNKDKSTWRYYRVKQGDSVESVSEKFRISVADLVSINQIKDNKLNAGDRIRVR